MNFLFHSTINYDKLCIRGIFGNTFSNEDDEAIFIEVFTDLKVGHFNLVTPINQKKRL